MRIRIRNSGLYILPLTLQERPATADPERWEPLHLAAVGAGDGRSQPRDDQLHLLRLQLLLILHQLRLLALPLRLVCRRYEWPLCHCCGQFLVGSGTTYCGSGSFIILLSPLAPDPTIKRPQFWALPLRLVCRRYETTNGYYYITSVVRFRLDPERLTADPDPDLSFDFT